MPHAFSDEGKQKCANYKGLENFKIITTFFVLFFGRWLKHEPFKSGGKFFFYSLKYIFTA
jgi:hypothetical protein